MFDAQAGKSSKYAANAICTGTLAAPPVCNPLATHMDLAVPRFAASAVVLPGVPNIDFFGEPGDNFLPAGLGIEKTCLGYEDATCSG
jgi:hypothetical protein